MRRNRATDAASYVVTTILWALFWTVVIVGIGAIIIEYRYVFRLIGIH